LTLRILALTLIGILVLFPAWSLLHRLRRAGKMGAADDVTDRFLRDAPRQLVSELIVLTLFLAALTIAVLMHAGPF
jgi:hypothetical protein